MNKVTIIRKMIILGISIMLMGCLKPNEPEVGEGAWSEPFIGTFNIDGSEVELLTSMHNNSLSSARPYFVKDIAGTAEEIILLDLYDERIELMLLDGSNRRTILDSLSGVQCFNQERSKMLISQDGEIYLCNVDGSGLTNITNTPDIHERDPSFSYNEESIIYSAYIFPDNLSISNMCEYEIATNEVSVLFSHQEAYHYVYTGVFHPAKISPEKVSYQFLTDHSAEDSYSVNSLMKYDLQEDFVEELCTNIGWINYSHSKEFLAYKDNGGYLVNLLTGDILSFDCESSDPWFSFSVSDRYLSMNTGVLDLTTNTKYLFSNSNFFKKYNTVKQVHMNMNEDRLIGIVSVLHNY